MNPICPYCPDGVEMVPVRESVGMMRGHDWLQCPKCASRGPEIRTDNGDWEGKQAAAISAALQRVEPNRVLAFDALIVLDGYTPLWFEYRDGDLELLARHELDEEMDIEAAREAYNKTGRCWLRRPTDPEREAAKWEDAK